MSWAKAHRWLAVALVVLLVVWSITGALFHLKPGWSRAYDQLTIERHDTPVALQRLIPIVELGGVVTKLEAFDTAIGPLYRVRTAAGTELVDALTGRPRTLGDAEVRALVGDAVSRSPHRHAYGYVSTVTLEGRTARVAFSEGPVVELGLDDARISQRGPDTDRIDWLYRIHYLQWTGNAGIDRWLAIAGLALIWAVLIPGLVLFVRALRRRASYG